MRPLIHYYGSAWRKTRQRMYPAPRRSTVVEPFAGGAGYSLFHEPRKVILCDLDPVICGVWRYLLSVSPKELLALPNLDLNTPLDTLKWPCQEAMWLAGFWAGVGSQYPAKPPSKWCREYSQAQPGRFWTPTLKMRIARQLPGLQNWEIHECSFMDLPGKVLELDATWFIDPPYMDKGKHYRCGSADIDFEHLGAWCKKRHGQVIVCEQEGATWLPFEPAGVVQTARKDLTSSEVAWLSLQEDKPWKQGRLWGGAS